ncbi:MAG: hypothetical protein ACYTFK_00010 [Planctomycetota bacterium]|jgi:hypothetical protein
MLEVILILFVVFVWFTLAQTPIPRIVFSSGKDPSPNETPQQEKAKAFSCLVELAGTDAQGCEAAAFNIKMRGLISASENQRDVDVQILIADDTDEPEEPRPVLSTTKQYQMEDSPAFCFRAHIGKLPNCVTVLSDWTQIAKIRIDLLRFPRQGTRKLKFITSIISVAGDRELACSQAGIDHENNQVGYIDARENHQRADILTVQLAAAAVFSFAPKSTEAALGVIYDWISAKSKVHTSGSLDKVLKDAFESENAHDQPDIDAVCKEMIESATIIERYEAIELCLCVARGTGNIGPEQTAVLNRLADSLGVDPDKFQAKVQKILPLDIYQNKDVEFILGITPEMNDDQARKQLNKEYRKWNGRVTHPDPDTQAQAKGMLNLIADARTKYTEKTCTT